MTAHITTADVTALYARRTPDVSARTTHVPTILERNSSTGHLTISVAPGYGDDHARVADWYNAHADGAYAEDEDDYVRLTLLHTPGVPVDLLDDSEAVLEHVEARGVLDLETHASLERTVYAPSLEDD